MADRPSVNQKCSTCSHAFGLHYTTYGGTSSGCSHFIDSQRDAGECSCRGFSMIWQQPPAGQGSGDE